MGQTSTTVFERTETTGPNGEPDVDFVPASVGGVSNPSGGMESADDEMLELLKHAEVVGEESMGGRKAYHLRADDIEEMQNVGNGEFKVTSMSIWIDTDAYVPLKMAMNGIISEGGQEREGTVVVTQEDYRDVPGSKMYEPFKQTVSMKSAMSEADMAQLEQARMELEKLDEQLAQMPEGQRKMMEQMMGPQIEAMRQLVEEGGLNLEIVVSSIEVNPE